MFIYRNFLEVAILGTIDLVIFICGVIRWDGVLFAFFALFHSVAVRQVNPPGHLEQIRMVL